MSRPVFASLPSFHQVILLPKTTGQSTPRTASAFVIFLLVLFGTSLQLQAAAPAISSLSPTYGVSGTPVTITGSNFGATQGSSTVKFGDWGNNVSAVTAQVTSWSNTSIVAVVPAFLTGASYFQVVVGSKSNEAGFAVTNPLTYSLAPSAGVAGTSVTIWGVNFGLAQGTSTVTFGGINAEVTSWNNYSIVVPVPPGVPNGNITVQVTVGGLAAGTQTFAVSTNPFISFLSSNSAPVDQDITITGINFGTSQGSSTVTFNGVSAIADSWTNTSISVAVPASATTGNVAVTVDGTSSNPVAFMVTPPAHDGGVGFVQGNYSSVPTPEWSSPPAQCFQVIPSGGMLTTAFNVSFPVEQTPGDVNLVIQSWRDNNSSDLRVIADGSSSNQYWPYSQENQSGNGQQTGWFSSGIVGGLNYVTAVFTSTHGCITAPEVIIAEYRGLSPNGYAAEDVTATKNSSGSATCNSGSVTTTNQNDVLIGENLAGMPTITAGTNYTNRLITTPGGNILEDRIVTATGSYNATATMSAKGDCIMNMVAFKEAPNQAPVVDAGPNQTITLPANSVTLDGTATDDGLPNNTLTISWSKVSGPGTVTFSSGSTASTQATFSAAGSYVLQLSANDSELTSSADVTITVTPEPILIVLAPSMVGPDVPGASQTMTATVTGTAGAVISGASVQFTVTGANATSGSGSTNSSGVATFSYKGNAQGTDTVLATYGGATSNPATVTWVTPAQKISTNTVLGRFFPNQGNSCSFITSPTSTPIFTQEFPTINFNPPAGTVAGNTTNVGDSSRPVTDITTDLNGNFSGEIVAQGNDNQAGVGPQYTPGGLYAFQAVFTSSFTVASAGNTTIRLWDDDGIILGIGGGATLVSGPSTSGTNPGPTTPFTGLPVMYYYNQVTQGGPQGFTLVMNFPAPGTYPYELDYVECDGGEVAMTMSVGASGAPPAGSLELTPITPPSINVGQAQTLSVQALNGAGTPVSNLSVGFVVDGANQQTLTGTTNSSGQASAQYTGVNAGTDTVQALANIGGMASLSNVATVPWTISSGGGGGCSTYVFTPQGWIGSPAVGALIQGQIPITLAAGITLGSGTLSFYPSSNPSQVTVLNSNTTGTGPLTLGTIDSTLLANGEYTIQLEATQSGGSCQLNEIVVSVTGQYKPGREVVTVTDFKVPLAGIPINITRTYDSLNRATIGDFGYGWNLSTNVNLSVDQLMDVTFTWNGKTQAFYFTPQPAGNFLFPWVVSPAYTPQPGLYGTLTSNGCDILIYSGGALVQDQAGVVCFPGGIYQPTIYTYTDPSGRVYTIASTGQLQSIKDLNGNTLSFTLTGITSSAGGVVVPFVRDNQSRITQITDLNNNNYTYSYDSNGNLQTVQYPGLSTTANYTYQSDHSLLTQTDPVGNETVATYYSNGRLQTFTDAMRDEWQYSYNIPTNTTTTTDPDGGAVVEIDDNMGKPLSITDPLNRTTHYTYDANENMLTMKDPLQNITTYTYDFNGNQTSVLDPLQHKSTKTYNQYAELLTATDAANTNTQTLTYDADGNVLQMTDLLNGSGSQVFSASYDGLGDVLSTTDANGTTTDYTYDPKGNLIQVTDPLSEITNNTYDPMDRILTTTDPRGNTTKFTYDALGNLKTKTDALSDVTSYTYDANGNKLSAMDANNHTTNYQYDGLNRLVKTMYPDGTTTQATYDYRSHFLTQTDQLGRVTQYAYDEAGELQTATYAYGTVDAGAITYTYDTDSRQKTIKDEVGNTTTNNYDNGSRLTSVQDAVTNVTNYGYDSDNRLTSVMDPNQHTTSYVYDARSRLTKTIYNDNTTTQHTYDGIGRVLTTTDQASQVTTDSYDADGRLLSAKDSIGNLTQYRYDFDGNLIFVTDADGRVTSYQYDPLNRVIVRTLPLGQVEYKGYDPVNNLISRTDFDGNATTYTYDMLNRLLTKVPDPVLNEPTVTFTYTFTGKPASMADASGTTSYTYNNRDHVLTKATPEGTLSYTYDAHENLLTLASSNTNGASMTYTYDPLNRLASAKDNRIAAQGGPSNPTKYSYDPAGNLTGYAYSNSVQAGNVFDTLNRLTQACQATSSPACSAGTKLSSYTYTLGAAGNRTNVAELNGRSVAYGYDADYHLKSETITNDPAANNGVETYTYDAVGNRLTLNSTIPSLPGSMTYSYDANDRLSTDTYDNDGNTIASAGISNTYDWENQMLTHGAVSMVYDGDGNRVSETVGGVTTTFLVDTLNPTRYSQVMDELVSSSVTRTYAYGLQRISENQLVSGAWSPSFYGYDGHGNARFLTNTSGTIGNMYTLDAFGAQIASTGTTSNPYLYGGERLDPNLSFYNLRERYYNALTGRFEAMDPQPGIIWHPLTLHRYGYAEQNPVNRDDPSGEQDVEEYGVNTIGTYDKLTRLSEVGDGLENHHLIPKSFACIFGVASGEMLAIALLPGPHQAYDNAWNNWWRDFGRPGERCNEELVGVEALLAAAGTIYAANPEIMAEINNWFASLSQ
jgi:RHS repeat-associated protein